MKKTYEERKAEENARWRPPAPWELRSMEETKEREREDGAPEYGPYTMRQKLNHYWEDRKQ